MASGQRCILWVVPSLRREKQSTTPQNTVKVQQSLAKLAHLVNPNAPITAYARTFGSTPLSYGLNNSDMNFPKFVWITFRYTQLLICVMTLIILFQRCNIHINTHIYTNKHYFCFLCQSTDTFLEDPTFVVVNRIRFLEAEKEAESL